VLASVARYAIIVYAAFAALTELGIAVQLTAPTFLIVLGGAALAAIAFGWGGRDVAKDIIERYYDRQDEEVTTNTRLDPYRRARSARGRNLIAPAPADRQTSCPRSRIGSGEGRTVESWLRMPTRSNPPRRSGRL
jgi:hypothetical protein